MEKGQLNEVRNVARSNMDVNISTRISSIPHAVVEPHQVARVRVRVKQAYLQQLHQERFLPDRNERPDFRGFALRQLHSVHPFGDQHFSGAQMAKSVGHVHACNLFLREQLLHFVLVRELVQEVELSV